MQRTLFNIIHAAMTNQFIILAMAIVLSLLAITMGDQRHSEAVISRLWT